MTDDDLTRDLTLLADEAEPAPVDPYEVITRARTRTRNRRATTAAALATFALVGALVATVGPGGATDMSTATTAAAADDTLPDLLTSQLTGALPDVIPADWAQVAEPASQHPPLTFRCDVPPKPSPGQDQGRPTGCFAHAIYNDGVGDINVLLYVDMHEPDFDGGCDELYCPQWAPPAKETLPDGTRAQMTTYTEKPTARDIQELLASRPDGTQIRMALTWRQDQRSEPALTTAEILRFATLFTFDPTLPTEPGTPSTNDITDESKRQAQATQELTAVVREVIPQGWSPANEGDEPPLTFDCSLIPWGKGELDETGELPESEGCWTHGYYQDGAGTIGVTLTVSRQPLYFDKSCAAPHCADQTLPDGTRTRVWTAYVEQTREYKHEVTAIRPDGTCVWVQTSWTDYRSTTPLTDENLLTFAMAFTF